MEQMVEENEKEVGQLNARIWHLEGEIERCNRLVVSWSTRSQGLEEELCKEIQIRENTQREITALRQANSGSDDTVPLPPRRHPNADPSAATVSQDAGVRSLPVEQIEPTFGCGKCRIDTRCECVENAFEIMGAADDDPNTSLKRPHSPTPMAENKRPRQDPIEVNPEGDDKEIDFTSHFATKRPPALTTSASSASLTATVAADPCGFCQDGTACICAELAAEEHKENGEKEPSPNLPVTKSAFGVSRNPCINGPGTCAQCRSDANSTLFCKSLAATRSDPRPTSNPTIASKNDSQPSSTRDSSNNSAITGVSLSCADAYTTLSRHPAYERASEDPGSWMPNLTTVPTDTSMTAFEIEAASILQTLRSFDRGFGTNK